PSFLTIIFSANWISSTAKRTSRAWPPIVRMLMPTPPAPSGRGRVIGGRIPNDHELDIFRQRAIERDLRRIVPHESGEVERRGDQIGHGQLVIPDGPRDIIIEEL